MQTNQARWNTLRTLTGILALALTTTVATQVASADVYTDPVGFITLTARGTADPGAGNAFIGLGMTQLPANLGYVGAVSGNQITLSNQTLTAGAYARVTTPVTNAAYFIEITSGPNSGLMSDIVTNDATSVTVGDLYPGSIVGATYKIYPHWTIGKVFGAANQAGLKPGDSTTADLVRAFNPATQGFANYYYATATKALSAGWKGQTTANTDQSATTLYIDQGFVIQKQTTTNLNVLLVGAVKLTNGVAPFTTGYNFAGNMFATSAMTLSNSLLYNGGNQTNSLVAGDATTADLVKVQAVNGTVATYYYATATKALSAGWKGTTTANTDQGGVSIPIGASVLVQIKSPRPGFDWNAKAQY